MRLTPSRYYSTARKAWTPRLWPQILFDVMIVFPLAFFFRNEPFITMGIAFVVGFVVGNCRWVIWRRQHPLIPTEVLLAEHWADVREKAKWN